MSKTQVGIQLVLEGSAQAEAGLKRFSGSLSQMDSAVSAARQSLVSLAPALGAAFSAAGLAQMVKGVQDAASEVERLSRLAGSTPQEFQRFAAGAKSVNVDLEKFASIMKDAQDKLGDFMQTGGGELKDFFEKIGPKVGVTAESFKNLSGPQALQLFYNSLQKANLSQKETVFWMESIADDATLLAPLLANNGAEFERLADKAQAAGVVMSDYLLAASKDLSQQTGALDDQLKAAGNTIAEQLFPALTEAARALVDFNRDGELASMAAAGIRTAFETVVIVGANVAYVIKQTGVELGGLAAQAAAVAKLDFKGAGRIGEMMREDAAAARAELDAFERRLLDAGKNSKAFFDVTQDLKAAKFGSDAYIQSVEKLVAMQASGKITVEQLNATLRAVQPAAQAAGKGLSGMGVGAEDAKKAAEAAKKAAESLKKSYQDAMGAGAQQARDLAAETDKLNAAEKKLADLMAGDAWPKWTEAQRAAVQALYERNSQTIKAQELAKAEAKWMEQSATENQKFADSAYEAADALEQQLKEQLQANEAIGLTGTALAELEASRLRDAAAEKTRLAAIMEGIDPGIAEIYRRQAAVLDELAAAKLAGGIKQAAAEASKAAQEEWRDASREIERSLTDALLRGFESGKDFGRNLVDTLKNLFKSLVLRPVIQAIVQPVAGAVLGSLGLPGVTQAAQAVQAGAGGNVLSLAGAAQSAYSALSNGISSSIETGFTRLMSSSFGESLGLAQPVGYTTGSGVQYGLSRTGASVGSALGMAGNAFAGYAISQGLSGGYQVGSGKIVDAITLAASAYFGPIAGVAAAAFNRAFGRKLADMGVQGTFGGAAGFAGQNYQFYEGGWFRSDKTKTSELAPELQSGLATQFKTLQVSMGLMADTLGLSTDAVRDFTADVKISFKGLTEEQVQTRLQEEFAKIGNSMASAALATTEYTRTGETSTQTLQRLSGSLTTVNGAFDVLGLTLYEASVRGGDMASQLIDLMGGMEKFQAATAGYYQDYYTEAERNAVATRQMTESLSMLIPALPATREGFRALVEAQDLATESGRAAYAALMNLAPAFSEIVRYSEAAADAASQALADSLQSSMGAFQSLASRAAGYGNTSGLESYLQRLRGAFDAAGSLSDRVAILDSIASTESAIAAARQAGRQAEIDTLNARKSALQEQLSTANGVLSAAQGLRRYVADLRVSAASPASDAERMQTLAARYRMQTTLAAAGDTASLSSVQGTASAYLESVRAQAATSGEYALIFAKVAGELDALGATTEDAATRQIRLLQGQLDGIDRQVEALQSIQETSELTRALTESLLQQAADQLQHDLEAAALQLTATDNVAAAIAKLSPELAAILSSAISSLSSAISSLAAGMRPGAGGSGGGTGGSGGSGGSLSGGGSGGMSVGLSYATGPGGIGADQYYANIRAYTSQHDFSNPSEVVALASEAAQWGISMQDLVTATGSSYQEVRDLFAGIGLPEFAVGTNRVPRDMIAMIHEGEAIVPKPYNPAASAGGFGSAPNTERLERLVESLTAEVQRLQAVVSEGNYQARRAADAVNGRPEQPMPVETI